MFIYLSASFGRRAELRAIIPQLEASGHKVVARWLRSSHDGDGVPASIARTYAAEDLEDLATCGLMILFLGATSTAKGGKACELGFALACGIPVWCVGDPGTFTIFHLLATKHFEDWDACKDALDTEN